MNAVVLDASALLALLNNEVGAEKVAQVLAQSRMSSVNLAEVVSVFTHAGMPPDAIRAMLHALPIDIVAADEDLAYAAGGLRAATASAGLSLGDRYCLALANRLGLRAMTADRQWRGVAEAIDAQIELIR